MRDNGRGVIVDNIFVKFLWYWDFEWVCSEVFESIWICGFLEVVWLVWSVC